MALEHEALTERIIGAAIEVHRRLGPGFLESVYEKALIFAKTTLEPKRVISSASLSRDRVADPPAPGRHAATAASRAGGLITWFRGV